MRLKKNKTERGFAYIKFQDRNDVECKIQKSSLATEDAIWFGATEIGLKEFIAGRGWKDVELANETGHHHIANNSMHLTRSMVKKLLPVLRDFTETGDVRLAKKLPTTAEEEKTEFGNIYGTDTVFMTIDVPLWNQDRRNYKITANMENGAALVYSMKTGKWFEIPPDQLVELAVKAGVDE